MTDDRQFSSAKGDPMAPAPMDSVIPSGELTFGGKAVGLTFNPSGDQAVQRCKEMFANCIDQMDALRKGASPEVARMASIAITEAQTAQMWAVKAITWRG